MTANFLALAGAVALLVWGLYMIKTGILRTFGEPLRNWLSTRLTSRFAGFAAGFGLATLLQSSTASALLVAGLQQKGLVTTAIALSCVLGADLGSAAVVRVLSLDLSVLVPILTLCGVTLFIRRQESRSGQFGRILLGLAFVMMSLRMIVAATTPMRESAALQSLFVHINSEPILACVLGCALAFFCFSSLAVVVIAAAAVASSILAPQAGLWLVLGANLGSALVAVLSTMRSSPVARRAPVGNLLFRSVGFIIGVVALCVFPQINRFFTQDPSELIVFHLYFNAVLGLAGLCFIHPVAHLVEAALPDSSLNPSTEVSLAVENLISPSAALGSANQEILRTATLLITFWKTLDILLKSNPPAGVVLEFKDQARMLARRCREISRFLNVLLRMGLPATDARRWLRLSTANDGLAYASEIAESIVRALEATKCSESSFFTPEGLEELLAQHAIITTELRTIESILQTPENSQESRAKLLRSIARREANTFELVARHMTRVAQGRSGAIATSALHVDLLTLFRRFESASASILGERV